jgi:hypothetical protein
VKVKSHLTGIETSQTRASIEKTIQESTYIESETIAERESAYKNSLDSSRLRVGMIGSLHIIPKLESDRNT